MTVPYEKRKEYFKRYRQEHREYFREYMRRYYREKVKGRALFAEIHDKYQKKLYFLKNSKI